ncbi:papain-like cysteine protease family protein [Adlercreutzia sp. R21]|uniref:papain-like cysteine protease family protein n=1 Tax=Adlercreutzia wanghongyangiae TaxID=3111451 RepID=UPI002DB8614A|nr:papain-like cysteine protease family protein [Adlercreutzia sp. R21]MEC4184580.1 papain-like cysteine protease family protein [Adlercreutzia sp. R21]
MRGLKKLIAIIWLSVMVACAVRMPAVADDFAADRERSDIVAAASMVEAMMGDANYQEDYNFPDVSIDLLRLGSPIRAYGGDPSDYSIICRPIYAEGSVVACLLAFDDGQDILYRLTTAEIEEVDRLMKENSSYLISLSDSGAHLRAINGTSADVSSLVDTRLLGGVSSVSELRSFAEQNQFQKYGDDSFLTQASKNEIPFLFSDEKAGEPLAAGVNASVRTWRVKQQGSLTCWAACSSSVGGYLTGVNRSDAQICRQILGVDNKAGTDANVVTALGLFCYPGGSTKVDGFVISGTMTDLNVRNWVGSGIPIIAHLARSGGGTGHDVVVCGYSTDSSGKQSVTIMNPTTGSYEEMRKDSIGVPAIGSSPSYQWRYSSIVPIRWQKPYGGSSWAYMNSNGTRTTGWKQVGGSWYYFSSSGYMLTGWQKVGGKWYYLQASGAAATGWQKIGSYWYAFDSSCAMRTGWFKDGSTWYYLRPAKDVPGAGPEGSMLAGGTWTIGGKAYRFNSSGACLNP